MKDLPVITTGQIVLLQSPPKEAMITVTTRMALTGPVCVLDAGNQFDAYQLARLVRRNTVELNKVLSRLKVARGFTCYQVVTLFEELSDTTVPHVVFDLLATFYDESVSLNESYRLLKIVISHLKRLRQTAPVVISLYPPRQKERTALVQAILDLADHMFIWEASPVMTPTKLF